MFKSWSNFEKGWLLISTLVALYIFFTTGNNIIGLTTTILGLLYVVNVARGSVWCFLFGGLQMVCYVTIAWQSKIYGDFALNLFYSLPMQLIGYLQWKKNQSKDNKLEIRHMSLKSGIIFASAWIAGIIIVGQILKGFGGNTPFIDATTTVSSVVAMLLSVGRFKEQWYLWIIVNSVSIVMWSLAILRGDMNGFSMLVMWSAYLVNAIYGMCNWNKLNKLHVKRK